MAVLAMPLVRAAKITMATLLGVTIALHPAWTVRATSGDCGITKEALSVASSVLGLIVVTGSALLFRAPRTKHEDSSNANDKAASTTMDHDDENPYRPSAR